MSGFWRFPVQKSSAPHGAVGVVSAGECNHCMVDLNIRFYTGMPFGSLGSIFGQLRKLTFCKLLENFATLCSLACGKCLASIIQRLAIEIQIPKCFDLLLNRPDLLED